MNCTHIPYNRTGYFSKLVTDYLDEHTDLNPFYSFKPDLQGIESAITERKKFPVDRKTLATTLESQYKDLPQHHPALHNIDLLRQENTFTICTAHQPNLLTGYLYFVYKIIHAIKLADDLKALYPSYNFVPVYYMGSEDNDLDELGTFRYAGKKFIWDAAGQTGAVGKMHTESLAPLLADLYKLLGPPGPNADAIKEILTHAYLQHNNIADATQYLVNELFGRFGLVVLNPDEPLFKKAFVNVLKDDLFNSTAFSIVSEQIQQLEQSYKAQAQPRPVNLFYLKDDIRERIETKKDGWHVLNTEIRFTREELENELDTHPERFSPNVILRGLFQETILPNIVFIGGGSELAYWLQLKTLFLNYNVFFPVILLRQSVLWIGGREAKTRKQLDLSIPDIFETELNLFREYVLRHSNSDWQTTGELHSFDTLIHQLKNKATAIDPTLKSSAEAALAKIKHQLEILEKKMLKAEKRKMQEILNKVSRLKKQLFPNNSLQERIDNFLEYYLLFGKEYFDMLYTCIQPLQNEFLIMED